MERKNWKCHFCGPHIFIFLKYYILVCLFSLCCSIYCRPKRYHIIYKNQGQVNIVCVFLSLATRSYLIYAYQGEEEAWHVHQDKIPCLKARILLDIEITETWKRQCLYRLRVQNVQRFVSTLKEQAFSFLFLWLRIWYRRERTSWYLNV